jgi:hypothetical protein
MSKNWEDGMRTGAYRNPGSRKRKKAGKPPDKGRRREGIHKRRMDQRKRPI